MGVFNPTDQGEHPGVFHRPTDRCFLCGEMLTGGRFIFWQGNDEAGTQIWLHPECAMRLANSLLFDVVRAAV